MGQRECAWAWAVAASTTAALGATVTTDAWADASDHVARAAEQASLAPVVADLRANATADFQPLWSLSALLDTRVFSQDGTPIGRIADLLFDGTGRLTTIILAPGGVLATVGARLPLPWQGVTFTPKADAVSVPFDQAILDAALRRRAAQAEAVAQGKAWSAERFLGTAVAGGNGDRHAIVKDVVIAAAGGYAVAAIVDGAGRDGSALRVLPWRRAWLADVRPRPSPPKRTPSVG